MIVIGDPHVLHKDDHWGELLRYSVQLKAYTGVALPHGVAAAARGEEARGDEGDLEAVRSQMERLMDDEEEGEPSDADEASDEEMAGAPSHRMQQEQLPFDRNE